MNHLISNPSGIDVAIKDMQADLYDGLSDHFTSIEGFGRVYKFPQDDSFIPKRYDVNVKDYESVYLDDTKGCSFFFIDGDDHDTEDGIVYTAPVKIVFWMDLSKLDDSHRADAEAHRLAAMFLKEVPLEFTYEGLEKGIDTVFKGFNTKDIQKDDLQPWHLFALKIKLSYYLTQKC
ncbi:hypothetical protein [Christiangramia crocea]|uniref:Uncharacterized protein n=1 Tax=Christiangramia crocea TaxID=2904124 RepID=A0A9X2A576_9FLAO|nr:hypothetical protein [Gramella crocea]MCG9970995.1 hypothetical protein [Gramella crocea]